MLQLKEITKEYRVGNGAVHALRGVTIDFRDNEFVAILGPSGCGKTTLLNIVGGLDSYTSGDLVINGTSTTAFRDAQWDAYRNHTIGFVFQSYNLIPHQTVVANVELALKLGRDVPASERRQRAMAALERVGLADQAEKRPGMLSGGQMQRVAIARALVNDPAVILADEPTGALDTVTSVQIMDLLKEVASDRLVIMVTHNPELADRYATRIVRLRDGAVVGDSNPVTPEELAAHEPGRLPRRTRLGWRTALGLSFTNLRTKKGRTFLTALAGAVGIIGIALILSLSRGMTGYIDDVQKGAMTSYPITIEAESVDLSGLMESAQASDMPTAGEPATTHDDDAVHANTRVVRQEQQVALSLAKNDLAAFKAYLDDPASEINAYIGENGVDYAYDLGFSVYTHDPTGALVDTNTVTLQGDDASSDGAMAGTGAYGPSGSDPMTKMASLGVAFGSPVSATSSYADLFARMLGGEDGLASDAVKDSYRVVAGSWPASAQDVVLVVDENGEVDLETMYKLGLLPASDYAAMSAAMSEGRTYDVGDESVSYDDIIGKTLDLIPTCDFYVRNEDGTWRWGGNDAQSIEAASEHAIQLTISGIVQRTDDAHYTIAGTIGYTNALQDLVIQHTNDAEVVQEQLADPTTDVLNGLPFATAGDASASTDGASASTDGMASATADDASAATDGMASAAGASSASDASSGSSSLLSAVWGAGKASGASSSGASAGGDASGESSALSSLGSLASAASALSNGGSPDGTTSTRTYDSVLSQLGYVNPDKPSSIDIYVDSFDDKEGVTHAIDDYNAQAPEGQRIVYTDLVGLLTDSVTTIVHSVTYVLIAFVAISLVVSSIMIAIITYVSVLERTKEIGVLRALGASKGDVSRIFNAETLIEGLFSGLLGVGIAALLDIPISALIKSIAGVSVTASVGVVPAVVLVLISVALTLIAGFIPSRLASRKDPAVALRSE